MNTVKTARSRISVSDLHSQSQECQANPISSALSYVIGPLDATHPVVLQTDLCDGEAYTLLVPLCLSPAIVTHPAFRNGSESNFLSEEEDSEQGEETTSVLQLVNHIYSCLTDTDTPYNDASGPVFANVLHWRVGWILHDLTRLAKTNRLLASVGMAYLCFILSLLPCMRAGNWSRYELYRASSMHRSAVKAYRKRIRVYREQGKSYDEAQQLALQSSEAGHVESRQTQ